MPHKIFINYRRSDTGAEAHLLHEKLSRSFGRDAVFMDVHDIQAGSIWENEINQSGASAKVVLVVIGDQWLETNESGKPRILEQRDWVRQEIEIALHRNLTIIPVCINNARIPDDAQIPASIRDFKKRQGVRIRLDRIDDDVKNLVRQLCPHLESPFACFVKANRSILITAATLLILFLLYLIIPPILKKEECKPFHNNVDIKTLIFDHEVEDRRVIEDIDAYISDQCQHRFINQNMVYEGKANFKVLDDIKSTARDCGADVYILPQGNSDNVTNVRFDFSNAEIQRYQVDHEFKLFTSSASMDPGNSGQGYQTDIDRAICLITAYVRQSQGRLEDAAAELSRCDFAHASSMIKEFAYNLKADSYIKRNQLDSAVFCLEIASKLDEENSDLLLKKAIVAEKANQPDIAIASYTQLINSNYKSKTEITERRGDQYRKIEDYDKAKEDYQDVIRKNPENDRAKSKLETVDKNIIDIQVNTSGQNTANLVPADRVKLADQLIQTGQITRALNILQSVEPNDPQSDKARALEMEGRIKMGDTAVIKTIPNNLLLQNQRLRTAVKRQQLDRRKSG